MPYGVIVADPPWHYRNSGCRGAAENHYRTMSVNEIAALPIAALAADNSVLFQWATWPMLTEGLHVMASWGFTYVTGFSWIKIQGDPTRDLWGDLRVTPQYGVGFWVRGCSEPLLIGRRGDVTPETGDFIGVLSENLQHSRKPENFIADVGLAPSKKHSLDRWPDRDGNYEPGNVRWATWSEQMKNRGPLPPKTTAHRDAIRKALAGRPWSAARRAAQDAKRK